MNLHETRTRAALEALAAELTAAVVPRIPDGSAATPQVASSPQATSSPAASPEPVEAASAVVAAIDRPGQDAVIVAAGRTSVLSPTDIGREDLQSAHPSPPPEPVTEQTLFDMASVTKVAAALTAATLIDDGLLDLDAPVHEVLGERVPDPRITARMLMTHTAGLSPTLPLWTGDGDRETRLDRIAAAPLRSEPGTAHAYSCIGFILLGLLCEQLGGAPLPQLARTRVLSPAGANGAHWLPDESRAPQCAATEIDTATPRGLVQGIVHDETAWSTGPVGNAGLFATVADALALGRALAGRTDLRLSPATWELLRTDQLGDDIPVDGTWRQGLGLRIGHDLPNGSTALQFVGHPGFTGTSVLADPTSGAVGVLLTNRVHPHRDLHTVLRARRLVASLLLDEDSCPTDDAASHRDASDGSQAGAV